VREAAEAYARRVERGDSSAATRYNLGTALLALRQYDQARPHLEAAAERASEPDLRQRASYNAGNADLEPVAAGGGEGPDRAERLRRAIARYQRALLLAPGDFDAKWNLELARRLLEEEPPSSGGGGDDQADQGGGGGDEEQPQPAPAGPPQRSRSSAGEGNPELSQAEAEAILSEAEEQERDLQRRKLREAKGAVRAARDW
jgi:tetratricopeptide (TPR) repeat protein